MYERDLRNIVIGHHPPEKVELSKQFREYQTITEKLLWERLRRNAIDGLHFRRQQVIDGFIVDFYCHSAALVVELDGAIHANRQDYDLERTAVLEGRGLLVIRFSNARVQGEIEEVLTEIREAAVSRLPEDRPVRTRRTAEERRRERKTL